MRNPFDMTDLATSHEEDSSVTSEIRKNVRKKLGSAVSFLGAACFEGVAGFDFADNAPAIRAFNIVACLSFAGAAALQYRNANRAAERLPLLVEPAFQQTAFEDVAAQILQDTIPEHVEPFDWPTSN